MKKYRRKIKQFILLAVISAAFGGVITLLYAGSQYYKAKEKIKERNK